MNERLRIPIIIFVVLVIGAGAGLKFAGHKAPQPKRPGPVVPFTDPFVANLSDAGGNAYVSMKVAVQLAPMTASDAALFESGPGKHEGAAESYGGGMVAKDPTLRDAVLKAVTKFNSQTLLTASGKEELKKEILANFQQLAKAEALPKSEAAKHLPYESPYQIVDVFLPDFAIQPPS